MLLSRQIKSIILIANHLIAVYIPTYTQLPSTIQATPEKSNSSIVSRSTALRPRNTGESGEGGSCPRCRKRCPRGRIYMPRNCRVCIPCPPGLIPNMKSLICIKPEDKKADKDQTYQDKKKDLQSKYDYDQNERENQKREKKKLNRIRRIARCLPLVAIAMGSIIAGEWADEFFDEEYLSSPKVLEYWSEGLEIDDLKDDNGDDIFQDEAYIEEWVAIGNQIDEETYPNEVNPIIKREILQARDIQHQDAEVKSWNATTALVERPQLERRIVQFLPAIIPALVRGLLALGNVLARVGQIITRGFMRIAKGKGKKSPEQQHEAAGKIRNSKNWRTCLAAEKPSK